jgi:hypothetical protein
MIGFNGAIKLRAADLRSSQNAGMKEKENMKLEKERLISDGER